MNPFDETLTFFLADPDRLRSRWTSSSAFDAGELPRADESFEHRCAESSAEMASLEPSRLSLIPKIAC